MADNLPAVASPAAVTPDDLPAFQQLVRRMIKVWKSESSSDFMFAFDTVFGCDPFRGHRRYGRPTWHESLFAAWCPDLEPQVTLGTGAGGREKWGATSFTVDFLDRDRRKVYEIDGPSHRGADRQERDRRKDRFLESLGYEVFRVPNSLIERWAEDALMHIAERNLGLVDEANPVKVFRAKPLIEQVRRYEKGNEGWGLYSTLTPSSLPAMASQQTEETACLKEATAR